MKLNGLLAVAVLMLQPSISHADFWSKLRDSATDAAVDVLTKPKEEAKPKPAAVAKPKPKPVQAKTSSKKDNPLDREGVKALQECLNEKGFSAGVADGIAGRKTIAAVRAFKKAVYAQKGVTTKVTDDIDTDVLFGCSFYKAQPASSSLVFKGTLPITSSIDGKTYQLTWEAKKQPYFGYRVSYYIANGVSDKASRFSFKHSKVRYRCEKGTEEKTFPNGAFRKGNHAPFHKDVCGGKDGDLIGVSYAR